MRTSHVHFCVFMEKVAELHAEALGKPFVFGNCQAGWHAMMAACMRPDVVGPMVIPGEPCLTGPACRQECHALSRGGMAELGSIA